jgi:antitoxin ParD1/3/4
MAPSDRQIVVLPGRCGKPSLANFAKKPRLEQRRNAMATMNISLPDKMKQWVEDQVATGRYGNSSDYVRDLVRRDQERAEARDKLQQMVDDALASGISDMGRDELLARMRLKAKEAVEAKKSA